jgi:thiol-disulfide isomerase/thioredoxin
MKHRLFLLALGLAAFSAAASAVLAADTHVKGDKPARIAMGEKVTLEDYLVPGKTTIFDFTSKYCGPCQAIAPYVEKLHLTRDDIAVVSVDINRPDVKGIDWNSPVARQYDMHSIPHFKVFGPDGKLIAEGDPARKLVTSWFQ